MTSADDVLNQIDAALYDVTVSADAMRSRPGSEAPRPQAAVASGPREILIQRLIERHGLTRMTARHAVRAAERGSDSERAELVRAEARAVTAEMAERIRFAFQPMAEAAITALKQLSESIARLRADSHAFRHLPEAVDCKPTLPRDRPAWQSPYGPARRRR
ncbi:hypothetical protein ACIBAC_11425 [Streptomyces sp. NPDC051362]|uniref:hypothetical protein n=1 Tax=Streptomyces sp. NPDC051362 TaxID=3365651 RepID=UPI00378BAC5E